LQSLAVLRAEVGLCGCATEEDTEVYREDMYENMKERPREKRECGNLTVKTSFIGLI
jgi:hypothetical protein